MFSERTKIWAGFAVTSFVWGSTWMAIKIGLTSVPPLFAAGVRFLIAATVLWVIIKLKAIVVPRDRNTMLLYATLAVLSYSVPFGLVYWGTQFIPSGLSSILFAAYPFWVAIFSQLMLPGEQLNVAKVAGIVLGFTGIVIIFSGDVHWGAVTGFLGMIAVLSTTVMQGFCTILLKKYGQPISPFVINHVGMLLGGALLLVASFAGEDHGAIVWDAAAIGSILYLSLVGSVLAFVSYHWLLKRIEAVYLSLIAFINPIVAVILGAIVLRETLTPSVFLGATFVLSGILVANMKYLYAKMRATS